MSSLTCVCVRAPPSPPPLPPPPPHLPLQLLERLCDLLVVVAPDTLTPLGHAADSFTYQPLEEFLSQLPYNFRLLLTTRHHFFLFH